MDDERETCREWLAKLLPKNSHKHIEAILDYFADEPDIYAAEINGARVQIEQVSAYGLGIAIDANGNAVTVDFPHGARSVA